MLQKKFSSKEMSIEDRLEFIEFRQELLFNNTEVDRMLFEYNITQDQYIRIMDVMDEYRKMIIEGKETSHGKFEEKIYGIIDHLHGNYHFCEYISRAFMNEGRWEEVFPALYGDLPKYKGLIR